MRELIFAGYVIPYRVNTQKETLEILGIFSENEWGISLKVDRTKSKGA